jgi:hypothetical protein
MIDHEISAQLEAADIVLLLVSPDFLHSDYCYDVEMTRAMDRHRFLEKGFEYIAAYFENSLKELNVRNPEVDTSFKRIYANRFEAVAYVNGDEQSRCGIWLGSITRTDGLFFSYDGVGSGSSYNESMSVCDNGYTLYFEALGMAHFRQERDAKLTHEGAAEYFWSLFVEKLR